MSMIGYTIECEFLEPPDLMRNKKVYHKEKNEILKIYNVENYSSNKMLSVFWFTKRTVFDLYKDNHNHVCRVLAEKLILIKPGSIEEALYG